MKSNFLKTVVKFSAKKTMTSINTDEDDDNIFNSIPWKVRKTGRKFNFCITSTRNCINLNCNNGKPFTLYTGKRCNIKKRVHINIRKATVINIALKKNIFAFHDVIIGPNQSFCDICKQTAITNIDNLKFETKSVICPSFKPLDDLLDSIECKDSIKQTSIHSDKKRYDKNILLDVNTLSDIEIELCCGFSVINLKKILKKTNTNLSDC